MAKRPPETNPFVQALTIHGVWKMKQVGSEASVEAGQQSVYNVRLLDVDDRCSVYTGHLLGWFKELPASAKDMLIWIADHLQFETDYLEMEEEKYCSQMGCGKTTFYGAKQALTNRLLIPRALRRNTYWINPAYLYKGDRVKMYRGNVKEENEHPINRMKSGDKGDEIV